MTKQMLVHRGPWDDDDTTTTSKCPALQFIKSFIQAIDSPTRSSTPWSNYYSEMAIYHDTKGEALIGGYNIWEKTKNLLHPFSHIYNEPVEIRILPCDVVPGRYVVYGEFLTHFLLRGDVDGEEILMPKFEVLTLGLQDEEVVESIEGGSERSGGEGKVDVAVAGKLEGRDGRGNGGLRILDVKLFYDNAVIGRYVTEKRRREAMKRKFVEGEEG